MKLSITKDRLLNPVPPRVFLCNTARTIIGQLPATSINLNAKWRQYSDVSFEIQRTYVDILTGETKVHPLYDKVEAPRNCLVEGYGLFCLQDISDTSSNNDIKSVSAFSAEYATSNKYLTNWHINTGEIDSKEVLYNEAEFGIDYNTDRDSFYKFASGDFDPYENYYQRNYTDKDSYTYEQVQIEDENEYNALLEKSNAEYAQLADKLYMKTFPNVQFFNENPVYIQEFKKLYQRDFIEVIDNIIESFTFSVLLDEKKTYKDKKSISYTINPSPFDIFRKV